ncbi:FitA-like ribbon-helix-helix domain-containing protein [Knoellia sp. CPCC 206453]|uniref:FitA-like ribbon-helix-helix domain-containing protein n=1 Tax=Knoellia pratensis TaxID=3404796 RepID=UPI003609B4BF
MAAITIRKLPDDAKEKLRMRAAGHGRSMEAEARSILVNALDRSAASDLSWIEKLIAAGDTVGGVDLQFIPDEAATVAEFDER